MKNILLLISAVSLLAASCGSDLKTNPNEAIQQEVQTWLEGYNKQYQQLSTHAGEAEWNTNTMIIEGDSTNDIAFRKAKESLAQFTGSIDNIEKAKKYLTEKEKLTRLQQKQLDKILYLAANNPQSIKEVVTERISAEGEQITKLFGYAFKINGKEVTPNDIDGVLKKETDLKKRQAAWEASKEVGKTLKDGLVKLRELRNKTVQGLGYSDFFSYQVSDYGMTTQEMMDMLKKINSELWPLFRELHTWARYELSQKFGVKEVPDLIPAHWLNNRWAQDWSSMVEVKGMNLDSVLAAKDSMWLVQQAERFYVSIGCSELPQVFWDKSSLFPVPPGSKFKKNTHASAWHIDMDKDVRSLMSVLADAEWYETTHHELGHIYYFMEYSNPEVPVLLREGANRAYHEALGSLMGLASMQKPFLAGLNLLPPNSITNDTLALLKEALNYVIFIPWSSGVMSEFEHDLYAKNLPVDQFNKRWWELAAKYQGIAPPSERGEEFCDAATKTHINDDAGQYYDYALSYVLLFQLHDHISKNILKQNPHATNYYGNKEVGNFIREIMRPGASGDWRQLLRDKTGEELSAKAMLEYFNPLMEYLKNINQGRKYSLPENLQ